MTPTNEKLHDLLRAIPKVELWSRAAEALVINKAIKSKDNYFKQSIIKQYSI